MFAPRTLSFALTLAVLLLVETCIGKLAPTSSSLDRRQRRRAAIHRPVARRDVQDTSLLHDVDGTLNRLLHSGDMHEQTHYAGLQGSQWSLDILKEASHHGAKQTSDSQRTLQADGGGDAQAAAISPPFYPTPQVQGYNSKQWKAAVKKARAYIQRFTLEERVQLTTGVGWSVGPKPRCVGDIARIDRVGFPGLCLEDSPLGVRFADLVSVFPAGMTTAATFSSKLAFERGQAMGREFRGKGVNVALGPGMNIHRTPAGGRNWEMAGADPYLAGEAAYQTVLGLQSQGVQACAKHLIGNEQEINRNTYSSNIDARTLREVYLHPFMRSIQAGVASLMCSYNLLDNSWACQNSDLLNNVLKTELGFDGYVMSDWGAQHSGVASANAGLDMTMPGQVECCDAKNVGSYWGANLTMAVQNGSVEASRLEDMGTRILAAWYMLGQDKQYPRPNFDAFDPFYGDHLNVMSAKHSKVIREIGAAGAVLLKNTKNALPLRSKSLRKLAVVGSGAAPAQRGANAFSDRGGVDGVVGIGWGSGTAEYGYLVSPYEALQARARADNTGFYWSFDDFATGRAQTVSDARAGVDAAIVFVHSDSGENYIAVDGNMGDRNNLTLWANGDNLIHNVSAVQPNTIVVIHGPGQVDMESWIDNENVTAVIHAHMPGAEAGNAIVDVLYGDVNPSGRLPYTIAKKRSDYGADVQYFTAPDTATSQLDYGDKLNVDYRHFDANNIEPRFAFGHGLSYTKFSYANLKTRWLVEKSDDWNARPWSLPLPGWLFEDVLQVSFTVRNDGKRDGFEVPQVYLGFDAATDEPPKVLRKFDRFAIPAGQKRTVTFNFTRYDLSVYDAQQDNNQSRWSKPQGAVKLMVGASSRDIRLDMADVYA